MASALTLCWHLATIRDTAMRDELSNKLIWETLGRVGCVEAAGIAINKNITIAEALQEIQRAVRCAGRNIGMEESMDDQLAGADAAKTGRPVDNGIAKGLAQLRRPLPVVMPPWTSKHCCELVGHLLRSLEETRSHEMSPVSDEEIELWARACHLAMCWFIGALDDDPGKQAPIESFWLKEIPNLVSVTLAVALAEAEGITVLEAINKTGGDHAMYHLPVDGKACAWWVSADGNTQLSGPTELKHDMTEHGRAADFLRTISKVIGSNVNSLNPQDLDDLLDECHDGLVALVPDGGACDVSREEYEAFVERFGNLSDGELARRVSQFIDPGDDSLNQVGRSARRSILIRVHMMRAKIEQRERRAGATLVTSKRRQH